MSVSGTKIILDRVFFSIRFLLLCLAFFFHSNFAKSQSPGMLEFSGRTLTKGGNPLSGAVVTVYRNETIQQEQVKTGKNGKFRFYLIFGSDYKITFSYPGCVDMYLMVYAAKIPKTKSDIFPLYQTDIPFFETTDNTVRVSKYKNPITKIIYDGKKAFVDDEAYFTQFTKDLLIDPAEQARIAADKAAKEKEAEDKIEAEAKAKKDAEEKARKEAEEKILAEQREKEYALAKAEELRRLREDVANKKIEDETMETEAIRLQRAKEAKAALAKKNKEIQTNYVNNLLRMVAENERTAKQKEFNDQKQEARSNTVIEQMRREANVKAQSDKLREEQKLKQKKVLQNQQYKISEMRKLVEAAAFAERSVHINNQKKLPDVKGYAREELPNFSVTIDDGALKTVRTTVITKDKVMDTYRKETYFWGSVYYYKNNLEINETTYNKEVSFYVGFQNK